MSVQDNHEKTAAPSRRDFLRFSALGLAVPIAGMAVSACGGAGTAEKTAANAETAGNAATTRAAASGTHADSDHSGGTMAPNPQTPASAAEIRRRADEMDAHHEKGMKMFPAKTGKMGNQPMAPRIVNGVKVFELTAARMQWETEPGKFVEAFAYNGQVPGPQIRVTEGDRVRVVLKNELDQSTAVHFHGLLVPIDQDGVPFITQPPIKPGDTYTYEFTVPNAGSHMYHSHHNAAEQVGKGLLGAFIVAPRRPRAVERVDIDYVMILNDGSHGYTLNGKSFPATEPIVAKLGQKLRIRFMNEGMMIHPMHLHGMGMKVIDKDGYPQPMPWMCDTLNIAPGERWDVIVDCNNPGTWAFHCHILPHAETPSGMFGMVTALIVQK
ncbi:MAG TPA: multicopper oxidase domain-containing protein [Longimicrobium sp.]|jgi:FtsP/CotA-like multicopper oxidase with cupredoxin domain|uniref:multicopper oxidase family protein n=1 Tax=Longimicrobium sp. TaxID=2029185 RepID=UPI002ED9BE2A